MEVNLQEAIQDTDPNASPTKGNNAASEENVFKIEVVSEKVKDIEAVVQVLIEMEEVRIDHPENVTEEILGTVSGIGNLDSTMVFEISNQIQV